MSRSGYEETEDQWADIRWRGAVKSAIRGVRGQSLLREMLAGLDAMPEKILIAKELEENGEYCALGVVGRNRGLDLSAVDPDDCMEVAGVFGVAEALAAEIADINDMTNRTTAERWIYVRKWVADNIIW